MKYSSYLIGRHRQYRVCIAVAIGFSLRVAGVILPVTIYNYPIGVLPRWQVQPTVPTDIILEEKCTQWLPLIEAARQCDIARHRKAG